MKPSEEATARLIVEQLRNMRDSQFIGYIAVMMDGENPMAEYVSERLDMIAVSLAADEATYGTR